MLASSNICVTATFFISLSSMWWNGVYFYVYICTLKWYNLARGDFVVEAYRKAKIDKLLIKLKSRKAELENGLKTMDDKSYLHGVVTGQIIELNYTIMEMNSEFKLGE